MAYGILDRHPNLRVMLAHAFFLSNNPNEMIRVFEKYPNVTIDLDPGGEMFDGFRERYDDWYKIFRDYSDRIFYATDATISGGIEYVSSLAQKVYRFLKTDDVFEVPRNHTAHGIKLEQDYLNNILYNNSKRNMGEKPKKINRSALKKYINTYLPLMPASKNKEMMGEYYRRCLL
ncbi:MAG: amidohydrolase family protein [Eubacteriales bacterium]|nr:amidohydrolase family protein [Eubacteriales bacterium]